MSPEHRLLGFDLLRPEWLAWALASPAILAAGWYALRVRRRQRALLVAARHVERFLPGHSDARALLRVLLASAGLALLAFAAAGPVRGYTVREIERRGLDLVVCIDTSRSMLVRDLRPDRITRAKREVEGLLDHLRGDRVALVAFAGDARDVAPLTHDRTTLKALLRTLDTEGNTVGGTNLAVALQRALSLFDGRTGAHEAIVLITDGEDLEGEGLTLARQVAERGIRVYVVGMGTPEGGKIPLSRPDGSEGFVSDGEGAEVVSRLNDDDLQSIAAATGGEYLSAARFPTPLEELYEKRIRRLEGRELGRSEQWVPHDRFQWILVLAFACMLAEAGLRERSRSRAAAAVAVRAHAIQEAA